MEIYSIKFWNLFFLNKELFIRYNLRKIKKKHNVDNEIGS